MCIYPHSSLIFMIAHVNSTFLGCATHYRESWFYLCMYVYLCMCVWIYVYMFVRVFLCVCVLCMHVCVCTCVCVCLCMCVCVCLCVIYVQNFKACKFWECRKSGIFAILFSRITKYISYSLIDANQSFANEISSMKISLIP